MLSRLYINIVIFLLNLLNASDMQLQHIFFDILLHQFTSK